jgi:hypothetical protein
VFLGIAGEDKAKAAGKPKKEAAKKETAAQKKAREAKEAKAAASTSSNGDEDASSDPLAGIEISDDLRAKLVEMAQGADDAEAFQAAAYEDDEVLEQDELLTAFSDDDLLEGIWESLKA